MSESPAKILSGLTTVDKRNSKLGGCAGVFLNLFDWNRKRFIPHKMLPAERPKQVSKHHKDDKLPMAKLLLIADENTGGFPRSSPKKSGDHVAKVETPEKKPRKRTPSVVARLMGLETMPSPEPRRERKESETNRTYHHHDESREKRDFGISEHSFRITESKADPFKGKPIEIDGKLPEKHPNRQNLSDASHSGALIRHIPNRFDEPKPIFFSRIHSLSPCQAESAFRSILSPSKSHNKLISPIKSPLASKSAVRLFEAAAKILEPSMQPSTRGRNVGGIRSQVARPLLEDADREEKGGKRRTRPPPGPKGSSNLARSWKGRPLNTNSSETSADQKKRKVEQANSSRLSSTAMDQAHRQDGVVKTRTKLRQEKASSSSGNIRSDAGNEQENASNSHKRGVPVPSYQQALRRSGSVKDNAALTSSGQRLIRSKSVKEEKAPVGCNHAIQDHAPSRAAKEEKMKPDQRKQEQSSRRLSQSGIRNQTSKCESSSQGSSIITSVSSTSGSAGMLNYGRFISSRKDARVVKIEEGSKKTETGDSSLMRSLLRRRATTTGVGAKMKGECMDVTQSQSLLNKNTISLDESFMSEEGVTDESSCNYDGSSTSPKYEIQEIEVTNSGFHSCSNESSSCVENASCNATENSTSLAETGIEIDGVASERVRARWGTFDNITLQNLSSQVDTRHSSNMGIEDSIQSSCQSSFGDTASSHAHTDVGNRKREPVSYSGKTTAAILQELLTALSSSKSHFPLQTMSEDSATESSSGAGIASQLEVSCSTANSDYSRVHNSLSSDSEAIVGFQDMKGMSKDFKRFTARGESSFEENESACDECWQPSPISILESPFQDESSNSATITEGTVASQTEEGDSADSRGIVDCDKLMNTISRIHQIDISLVSLNRKTKQATKSEEEYVKEIVCAAKLSPADVYSARLQLSGALIDPALFNTLEEQAQSWEWGTSMPEDDDADSISRLDLDMSFRNHFEEAAVQNRKLIFDCTNEAVNLNLGVGEQLLNFSDEPPLHSSAMYLLRSVYRHIEEWRGMLCSMNVDDMVEKDMNTGVGRWSDFGSELSEMAVEIESSIFRGLVEELMWDVSSSFKVPNKSGKHLGKVFLR